MTFFTKFIFSATLVCCAIGTFAQTPCVRIVMVDPISDVVRLRNDDSQAIDITDWYFCALVSCVEIGTLPIIDGSLTIAVGDSIDIEYSGLSDNASDVGVYTDAIDFFNPDFMVDYMQFGGASGGLFNSATAEAKGIWTVGDFIDVAPPFVFRGVGCVDNGVDLWLDPNGISESELAASVAFRYDGDQVVVDFPTLTSAQLILMDINGRQVDNRVTYEGRYAISSADLPTGLYLLHIRVDGAILTEKILLGGLR